MRLSRAEAKRIALAGQARRVDARAVEERTRQQPCAPAERMSRRRLKAFHVKRAREMALCEP